MNEDDRSGLESKIHEEDSVDSGVKREPILSELYWRNWNIAQLLDDEKYGGKWVAVVSAGEIISGDSRVKVEELASKRSAECGINYDDVPVIYLVSEDTVF